MARTVKTGNGVREQGLYALKLGVGPPIYQIMPDGYCMATLDTSQSWSMDPAILLDKVFLVLQTCVWIHPEPAPNWKPFFEEWASEQPVPLMDQMRSLYATDKLRGTRIHGDPTLANAMFDRFGQVHIADPIEPKGKMPSFVSVDIGKLLQSVAGWEHVTLGASMMDADSIQRFCERLQPSHLKRGMFWLMVHALRILPYAKGSSCDHTLISWWANEVASIIHRDTQKGIEPCSTLMTLTERSRILAAQFYPPTDRSE
jgi:hypothetical protein